ncbi:lysozyme [Paraburkholderia tropica]|uniref:lysozyme n=1 Tax=Paraburkholderia tropica TaxID=92647 RepID=UPI0009F65E80|nr:lysozyme [Paraburkholderia tropica]MBB2978026.1 lysozyme [Paraburkholderia tropica]QNB10118.1 lysozyme [Paraburkholderia tropica]
MADLSTKSTISIYAGRISKPWKASKEGLSFISVWESGLLNGVNFQGHQVIDGFILKAYRDNVGIPTVASGHRILPADHIALGQTISLERAREFKRRDLERMEQRLNGDVNVELYQFEYDALVSIVFNCGPNGGADDIIDKVNGGRYGEMFDYILEYRIGKNKKLRTRRYAEARLFASGVYDAEH